MLRREVLVSSAPNGGLSAFWGRPFGKASLKSAYEGGLIKTVSIQDAIIPDKHIGVQMWSADHSVGEHQHNFLEMIYILEGTATEYIDRVPYKVKHGDFLFVNYGKTHSFEIEGPFKYIEVMFDITFITRELINTKNAFDILSLANKNKRQNACFK